MPDIEMDDDIQMDPDIQMDSPATAAPAVEQPPSDTIDLNKPQAPQVRVLTNDTYAKVPSQMARDYVSEQMKASLAEDARRVKKFATETAPKAITAGMQLNEDVGNFLIDGQMEVPAQYTQPYGADSTAGQLDAFLNRPPMEQLQVLGHGLAPETVQAPKDVPGIPATDPRSVVGALSSIKDAAFSPAVAAVQGAQKLAAVPINAALKPEYNPQFQGPGGPASELVLRHVASAIGGEDVAPNPDDPQMAKGVEELGAGYLPVMVAAEAARQAPWFLVNTGAGTRAVAAERASVLRNAALTAPEATAAKLAPLAVKEATVEGATQVGLQTALTPGQDVVVGPVAMTLFGHMAGKAMAEPLARAQTMAHTAASFERWALMPAQTWDQFVGDIGAVASGVRKTAQDVRVGAALKGRGDYGAPGLSARTTKMTIDVASGKVRPAENVRVQNARAPGVDVEFKPTLALYARNEAGTRVGREVMVTFPVPGEATLTFRDAPIDTFKDAQRWEAQLRKNGIGQVELTGRTPESEVVEPQPDTLLNPGTPENMAPEEAIKDPRVANYVALQADLKKVAEERARRAAGEAAGEEFAAATKPGMRAQGAKPVAVNVDAQQRMRVTPIADPVPKDPTTWRIARGDLVQSPDGTPYVVQGFTPDGKVLARMPGARGKPKVWDNASLKFISDAEGLNRQDFGPQRPPVNVLEHTAPLSLRELTGPVPWTAKPQHQLVTDIIKELGTVTVPRLAKVLHTDTVQAAQAILAHEHLLEPRAREPGVWDVKAQPALPAELRYEPWGDVPLETHKHRGEAYISRREGPPGFPGAKLHGHDEPVQWGTEVYYGLSKRGRPMKGVLRGPDPKKPNHYILETFSPTTMERLEEADALKTFTGEDGTKVKGLSSDSPFIHEVSVPLDKLRTTVPVNLAKPQLQKLFATKGLYGLTTPHPPNFVVASSSTAKAVNDAVRLAQASRLPEGLVKRAEAIQGQLLNAYYLTPPKLRRKAVKLYAAWPNARDAMLRISERLKDASGGYGTEYDQDLIGVLEANMSTDAADNTFKDWLFKNPHAGDSIKTVADLLNERKANSQWMADKGLSSIDWLEQARGAGEEKEYLTMMYNVDVLKDKYDTWVKKNQPHVWDAAVRELTRGGRNSWEVEDQLARIMRQKDPVEALSMSSLVDNTAFQKLKARGQWQKKYPAIAQLMGPVPSASLRLGHTIGYQRAIKAQLSAWDSIHDSAWWSPGPRADLTQPIPNEPRFGKAAGGYTHKSLANFITKKPEDAANEFARMMGWMGGKWKSFNTVYGGPTPWVNNILRNLKGVAISGAFQDPTEDMEGFLTAPRLLLGWRENPSMLGPYSIVGEAKQYSALSSGFAGAEIYDARKRIQDELLRAMTRAAGKAGTMEDMVMAAQEFMRTKAENVKDAYDAIDQYFKLATYINLRKRYIGQGYSIHDAAALAGEDINAAYPNFELTAPLVERNRGKWGWVAPFLSSKAEDMRINAMTMARIARTGAYAGQSLASKVLPVAAPSYAADPGVVLRTAMFGASVAGAVGLMRGLARSNGITAQDEQDAYNSLSLKRQSWSPFMVPMWDYDDQGRIQFIDLTPIEDVTMMFRGNPNDPLAARIVLNNIQDVVGDDSYIGRGTQSLMNAGGLISEAPDEPIPVLQGEGGVLNILGDYARSGGVPQFPIRAMNAFAKTQPNPMNPAQDVWSLPQAAVKAAGLPYAGPVGLGAAIGSLREARSGVRKLRNEARGIPRRLGGVDDPERMDYLLQSKLRGLGTVQQRINEVKVPKTLSPPATKPGTGGGK